MKECGDCAICCYHCNIPDMDSPAGQMCSKNTGTGCSIYESRPEICRPFECLWLQQPQIPDNLRPDRCGVMFETPFECDTWIGYVSPDKPDALEDDAVLKLIAKINESGHSVSVMTPNGMNHFSLAAGVSKEIMHEQINKACANHGVM